MTPLLVLFVFSWNKPIYWLIDWLLFIKSIVVVGYGHITPKTSWGQVVTILYAIFGIPLTLFTITNLGSIMATAFRFIYKYIALNCICTVKLSKSKNNILVLMLQKALVTKPVCTLWIPDYEAVHLQVHHNNIYFHCILYNKQLSKHVSMSVFRASQCPSGRSRKKWRGQYPRTLFRNIPSTLFHPRPHSAEKHCSQLWLQRQRQHRQGHKSS